jgi:23S rRNA pseudouridine2605 synthase
MFGEFYVKSLDIYYFQEQLDKRMVMKSNGNQASIIGKHRVQKLLSNRGFCSRRKAEEYIADGRVGVNGKVISLGDKAAEADIITVDGKRIERTRSVVYLFNKPPGCVTALTDERLRTVMDFIHVKERVFPIGRLDYNTSGLLLLTNDGDVANKIMHPRYEITKTYLVLLDRPIQRQDIKKLEAGVLLEDGKTYPAHVKKLTSVELELTIHEGRNRIIRRMFEALNYRARGLIRLKIGKLSLGNVKQGRWRRLAPKEVDLIFEKYEKR